MRQPARRVTRRSANAVNVNKQHILDEIRRTAQDNGGMPLGKGRFEGETGIKEGHWRGRFWARWGDAVREAGLTPNTLQPKTDDDLMFAELGKFVRELRRFPTVAEMRMRKRQDRNYPHEGVFARVGSRSELIERLAAFCEHTEGWSDVSAICRSQAAASSTQESSAEPENEDVEEGFVYLALMRVGREKRYKIGKANLVDHRARQIAVTLPEELELIHSIRTDDAYGIEAYWHRRFAKKRRSGEWFTLTAKDVVAFKRRKFM